MVRPASRGDAQGGFQRSVLKPLLWGEPPAFGGVGGTFPAPALPPQGETGKGESNQNSLLPQAITYWLMPESALSPQPPNSLEPLEARHSQFCNGPRYSPSPFSHSLRRPVEVFPSSQFSA